MPGLIAVAAAREAERTVREAARSLLRRPWQRLELVTDRACGVAIAFAGERGAVVSDPATGVVLGFDGELFMDGCVRTGVDAAGELTTRFLERGSLFDPPDGWFAAVVWDPRCDALVLVTDRVGHRPLYHARVGREVVAATELKALLGAGLQPELDPEAWAAILAYEAPVGDRTPLAGVRLVDPGTTLTLSLRGADEQHVRWRYRLEPASGDPRDLVEELGLVLGRAVERRLTPGTGLALSGGLDSRCLAAILSARTGETAAFSYGARGSEDLELGALVAARAGLPHRSLPLPPGYIAAGAAATVWASEGHVRCFHAHHLALRPLREVDGIEALLIGFAGDPVLRDAPLPATPSEAALVTAFHRARTGALSDDAAEEVLTQRFAGELRGLAQASLARALAEEEGAPAERAFQYLFRQTHRRKTIPGAELFLDDVAPRDPFDDAELIELCRRMPSDLRKDGALERAYLSTFHQLAGLRSPKDGVAPALSGLRRRTARWGVRLRRRGRALADARLGTVRLPSRGGLGDYATDLRHAGAPLLGVLLEPRTLVRGQVREAAVRRLVGDTLRGRARHTRVLGVLLTLELFQRQFLEGEAPVANGAPGAGRSLVP